ncbi:hypothetical protein [Ornithinibacillus xuwenensis]|uniref:Dehydratase n=1 Tax=Ornithinibacillus xuwenensis TaxID=3144668 RepID=A0ABU9XK39_9BACI
MKNGQRFTYSRTFQEEDIFQFATISGDNGKHHIEKDEQGRLMVQEL